MIGGPDEVDAVEVEVGPASAVEVEEIAACTATRRPGRPRDARAAEAILAAAADVLAQCGPAGFTVDAVAARAGVGKATIYRRWPSRAELLLETANQAALDLKDPDTGSVRADLVFVLSALAVKLRLTNAGRLMPALMAEAAINPEMSRTLAAFVEERRRLTLDLVTRAVDRGELPDDTDPSLLIDLVAGPIFYRTLVARHPVEPEDVEQMVDAALRALGAGGVRLPTPT
ncbi:MAG TPA: TetR/AcrR family transcriptional regulator [Acidimicrobiales bacterium]|nr:TetR/AcrR family transcriptional regulator [Acidimicrobiales bacterium]